MNTKKISKTCEVIVGSFPQMCGKPTTKAYPCKGGGYMALCAEHGRKHTEAWPIQEIEYELSRTE